MQLTTYNGEYFERNKVRYVIFFLIIGSVIVGSFLFDNIIGAIIILVFVGGYFFFLTKTHETITLKIEENGISIGKKFHPRSDYSGFVLEYHMKKKTIHNIVFLSAKGYEIFTISDTDEQLKTFITELSNHLPLLEKYEQSFWEKLSRKVQL